MAEASSKVEKTTKSENGDSLECAVCLQSCVHPAQLPCGHIFCFLCVKGIANQSKKCAMCRQEIPCDFLEQPHLLEHTLGETSVGFDGGYQWFYEGKNGWWQYDERNSKELEACHKRGEHLCELLIAGFLYVVDLRNMLQLRRNDPTRRRRIKRDVGTIPKKGIAGLKAEDAGNQTPTNGRQSPYDDDYDLDTIVEQIRLMPISDTTEDGFVFVG